MVKYGSKGEIYNMNNETKECRYCKVTINKKATVCPDCKRGQYEYIRYIIGLIVLIVCGCFIYFNLNKIFVKKEPLINNCNSLSKMSIVQLYEKNQENEMYAKENYVGKAFIFEGTVHDVNLKNEVRIEEDYISADVTFQKSDGLSNLKVGDKITFCAVVDEYFWGTADLYDAIMIK